ncbi:MAG: AraC family transcriptional regulator [Proteobacteria bacterium]|nr:AraC family transcriptional regulator [Pseudomonadota bacterium]
MTVLIQRTLKAIDHIEAHLSDDVQLAEVSGAACYSHYHFLRIFHALTGLTAGTYIRRRRLTKAAEALLNGETRIIEIAQDAGFESQAAFTRAFKDMFDESPAQFRSKKNASAFRGQPIISETYLQHIQIGGITMTPRFEQKEALTFIGLGKDYSLAEPNTIGLLWDDFLRLKHLIQNIMDDSGYGLCYAPKEKETFSDKFRYTAALRVDDHASVPDGMEKIHIPAYEYAVFTHKGSLESLSSTNDYIWKTWLPKSGFELADAPDIEIYGNRWNAETSTGEIDICLPIIR